LPLIIEPHVGLAPGLISFPKISVVADEADETLFWFELLVEADLIKSKLLEGLMKECEELLKIFSTSLATAKRNR
jgi:four helix bundle protein